MCDRKMHAELIKWANEARPWHEELLLPQNGTENSPASRKRSLTKIDTALPKRKRSRLQALGLENKENIIPINGAIKISIKNQPADKEAMLQTIRRCVANVVHGHVREIKNLDKLAVQTIFDNTLKTIQTMYDRKSIENVAALDEKQLLAQANRVCALNTNLLLLDGQVHEAKDRTPRNLSFNSQPINGEMITPRYETPLATTGNRFRTFQGSEKTDQSLEESSFVTPVHVTRKN